MALLCVRGPLKKLAGGEGRHELDGGTVGELLERLEDRHPELRGWILDERGRIRRHINVYVNGDQGEGRTPVGEGDRIDVLPAISGGER
ncbi:MAG TPA: MoaD/ThiS family protein [Solirubrobacteraceae bacterium]|jgi:molybdopterin converting factor small subunit|nr:MoaD/ThiS family protein [Solirubrobacteraceae bacterium]